MISWFSNIFQAEQIMWARPIPAPAVVAAFVAVVVLTIYLYRRRRGLPTWVHIVLAVSRLVVLCLIVAVLLEPTAVVKRTRTVKRRLPVLIDVSESMSVTDQRIKPEDLVEAAAALDILPSSVTADVNRAFMTLDAKQRQAIAAASRLDLVRSLLSQSARAMFESIGDDIDVSYYAFGKKLHMLGDGKSRVADSLASLKAVETGTFIAESLEAAASADRGAPLAGIVLLSDGLDTSSRGAKRRSMTWARAVFLFIPCRWVLPTPTTSLSAISSCRKSRSPVTRFRCASRSGPRATRNGPLT